MTAIMGWVRHNFWYKIASLALALVLWTYVVSSEPLVEEVIRVRVVPVNLAEGLQIVSVEPDNVPVSVRARRNLLSAIRRGVHPLELRADLSGRNEPGTHRVGLELVGLPRGASGTLSEHLFANIVVDKVVTRTWTIDDVRQGYPAGGFTVDSITLEPPTVEVRTVTAVLRRIDRVVAVVDVSDRSQNFRVRVPVQAWDNKDVPIAEVTIIPPETAAAVSLRRVEQKAVVVEPTVTAPAPGYRIVSIRCVPQTVPISGEGETLARIVSVPTDDIDLTRTATTTTRTVPLRPPNGIQLAGVNSATVTVEIEPLPPELTRPEAAAPEVAPAPPPREPPAAGEAEGGERETGGAARPPGTDEQRGSRNPSPASEPRTTPPST